MYFLKSVLHLIFHLVCYHQVLLAKLNLHIYYPDGNQEVWHSKFKKSDTTRSSRSSIGILKKRCSENMQQIYRRTPMSKLLCSVIEIALRHGCSPVILLDIFRASFLKNTYGRLLLYYKDANTCLHTI